MKIISPTGKGIRNDAGGLGHFGAPRTKTVNGVVVRYKHAGLDFSGVPGQEVVMPIEARIVRESIPYAGYSGVLIEGPRIHIRMWYLEFYPHLIGQLLPAGAPVGALQDISRKYKGVTPHLHLEVSACDPALFLEGTA